MAATSPADEVQRLVQELKQAIRDASVSRQGEDIPALGLTAGDSLGRLEAALKNLDAAYPLREFTFPARVPVVGRQVAWLQEQIGRLSSKWHTRNLLLQQSQVNIATRTALQALASTAAVQRSQVERVARLPMQLDALRSDLEALELRIAHLEAERAAPRAASAAGATSDRALGGEQRADAEPTALQIEPPSSDRDRGADPSPSELR